MGQYGGFDVERFQVEVDKAITELLDPSVEQVQETVTYRTHLYSYSMPKVPGGANRKAKAAALIRQDEVRKRICAGLQTGAKDAFEISKYVTPLLVGMRAAGTVVIPLEPLLFAIVALLIARMGVAALCAEDKDKKDE